MSTSTLFWPLDVRDGGEGICYGWTKPCICVIGVMINVATVREAEKALERVWALQDNRRLIAACGGRRPTVLGQYTINKGSATPAFHFLLPHGYNIIYYHRHAPSTLRFYALDDREEEQPARWQPDTGFWTLKSSREPSGMSNLVVEQFNAAQTIDATVQSSLRPASHFIRTDVLWSAFDITWAYIAPFMTFTSRFLNAMCSCTIFSQFTLKNVSATFQQMDVRAEQAEFFATEVKPLRLRGLASIPAFATRYTNFFNIIWLILNDITIGSAIGAFLCENHVVLSFKLNSMIKSLLVDWVQWVLEWLNSWPAGLKLNTELSRFYSHTLIDIVGLWGRVLQSCEKYSVSIVYALGVMSSGGATVTISLCSDILALATLHIYVCYFLNNLVYARFLQTFGSLWNLFRGKRYNVLRNRTDTWEYDIDQLLFGTILFTLVAFLFPTVLAYYSLFALLRFVIILLQACLETQLAFMNHFPLFALMLRAKDPRRLPGGIYFGVKEIGKDTYTLTVESQPLPFSAIFFQYSRLLSRLTRHYNPMRLLWQLLSGQLVEPIPKYSIRYGTRSLGAVSAHT